MMWYRFCQNSDEDPKPGWQEEMEFKSGLAKIKDIQKKLEESFKKLDPLTKQQFESRYQQLSNNNTTQKDAEQSESKFFAPLLKLYSEVLNQIKIQEVQSLNYVKSIVNDRYSNIKGYDQDKILKEYLAFENIDNIVSGIGLGDDLTEIAKYFLSNASNPKFVQIKNIMNKIPAAKWGIDLTSLIINFYLNDKLTQLINQLRNKKPFTFKDQTAISLIESKIATNSVKIGINLNNILNKNPLGQLAGQIAGVGVQGLENLNSMMGTNKSIKELIQGN
jgi:hypothetical protein